MEHAIEFLLEHHARVSVEIEQLKETQKEQGANIAKLSDTVAQIGVEIREGFAETRDAFDKLILANEITRDLAQKAAQLAIQASQRLTILEER
jgi:hypothetical protein